MGRAINAAVSSSTVPTQRPISMQVFVCVGVWVCGEGFKTSVGISDCLCVHLGPGLLLCVNYTSCRVYLYLWHDLILI